ncbi:MAG: hypothetical protein Q8Q15_01395 [bacterium]|nr:hypothetical protein [bacterium]
MIDQPPNVPFSTKKDFLHRFTNNLTRIQILFAFFIIAIIIIAGSVVINYFDLWNSNKSTAVIKAPVKPAFTRVDKLPEILKASPQIFKYNFSARNYVRIDGKIQEINKDGVSFLVDLDSGETVTIIIDAKTSLNKAYYDIDQNGKLLRISYKPITKQEVGVYPAGEKVRITYLEKDFSAQQPIRAQEFILLE